MKTYQLKIQLLSDTTFGRGDGIAGLIDEEVEHDLYGFPYLRGRTLKGLLSEECDNLITVLPVNNQHRWQGIACTLFGTPGSTIGMIASVHVGDAYLPEDLREAVAYQINQEKTLTKTEVLNSLTTIRRQTAIDFESGVADEGSLRSLRVISRQLDFYFTADLIFETPPTDEMVALLAVGVLALRRVGSGRNRGRGHVRCRLYNPDGKDITVEKADIFG